MSLSIWHELDHPTHPLSEADKNAVIYGAQVGHEAAQRQPGLRYADILTAQVNDSIFIPNHEGREFFVGEAIGVHAGIVGKDVETADDYGFTFSGNEIDMIRRSKDLGTAFADTYQQPTFGLKLNAVAEAARIRQDILVGTPTSMAVIGFSAGLRYKELSEERMAA